MKYIICVLFLIMATVSMADYTTAYYGLWGENIKVKEGQYFWNEGKTYLDGFTSIDSLTVEKLDVERVDCDTVTVTRINSGGSLTIIPATTITGIASLNGGCTIGGGMDIIKISYIGSYLAIIAGNEDYGVDTFWVYPDTI